MADAWRTTACVLAAYLVGAIPFGLLIGQLRGVDIRRLGSGNIGATNVERVLGWKLGKLCLVLDIAKGLVPTVAARAVLIRGEPDTAALWGWLAVALAAVLGHVFPIYLGFRGGKGVATTVGVAAGIYPYFTVAIGLALVGYAVARFATGLVSAGSLTLAAVFPLACWGFLRATGQPMAVFWPLPTVAVALAAVIVARHVGNIRRLARGEEMRATARVSAEATPNPPRANGRSGAESGAGAEQAGG